ncbi:MAG TPA: chloride channel protein [Thermoleophilaceae bacterium]
MTAAATPEELSGRAYLRLVALGALIGIPAALVAAGFLALVHELEDVLWHDLPDQLGYSSPPWYLVLGLPMLGACLVVAARSLLPGDGGHSPLEGLSAKPTPFAWGPGVALAALGTLAFGSVLGPEAPLIALGSVVGTAASSLVKLGPRENAVLATAGSFSAISALFGGPLVAGMLLVEAGVGMGAALIPSLLPGLVAAACGYLIFVGLGDWGGLDTTALAVPGLPEYNGTSIGDLLVGLAVGIAAAVLIVAVRRLAVGVDRLRGRRLGMPALLIAAGLAVGVLAELADVLGANSQDVLFSGQASVPALVAEGSTKIVLVLLVAKALGYAISLGSGFRGGPVFPAVFLGVALATLAVNLFDVSATLAVAVGTAAGMAAATQLLFASLLFAALLVGIPGLDAIPAAVFAAAAAWLTRTALDRRLGP